MKNSYGNYVIQKVLKLSNGHFKVKITNNIKKCLDKLTDKKLINKWTNILENMKTNNLGGDLNQNANGLKRKKSDESFLSNNSNNSNNNSFNSNNSFQSGNSIQSGNSFHSANNEKYILKRNFTNLNFGNVSFSNMSSNNVINFHNNNTNMNFMQNIQNNNDLQNPINNMILQNNNNDIFNPQYSQLISRSVENSPNMNYRNKDFFNHNHNNFYYKK